MPRRYLFGPATASFAMRHFREQRQAWGYTFGGAGSADLTIGLSWPFVQARGGQLHLVPLAESFSTTVLAQRLSQSMPKTAS